MKTLFIFLVFMTVVIGIDSLYFEYCVSRATPLFLTTLATIGIVVLNASMFVYIVKTIKKITKL